MADFRARLQADAHAIAFVPLGSPGPEIVKAAKEWQADLIMIGSHGRRGITRALVGSVAEGVMRHASCPVPRRPRQGATVAASRKTERWLLNAT